MDFSFLLMVLIPLGLTLFVISIKNILRFVNTKIIYEMPYTDGQGSFKISNEGRYALWLNGSQFTKSPLGQFGLTVTNKSTREDVPLYESILRSSVSFFKRGRTQLYSFEATRGTYIISLNDEASFRDKMSNFIIDAIIRKPVDYSLFSIQVREHVSTAVLIICILVNILGSFMIVSGIVFAMILGQ